MSWLRALRTWGAEDYALAVEGVGLALRVEVGLRRRPLPDLVATLGGHATPAAALRVHDVGRLARFAALPYRVLPFRATCLRESLVLVGLFRRRGIDAALRLGVQRSGAAIGAHAWVEVPGVGTWDAQAPAFAVLRPVSVASPAALDH